MRTMKNGFKRIMALAILLIAVMACSMAVCAAPQNTRGRIAIDLGTFEKAAKNGKGSHGLDQDGNEYQLHYLNKMISNHDNDGVTYRSKSTYDMTDVTKLEFYAYTMTDESHKFMVYCTSDANKTYQGRDYDSVGSGMYKEDSNVIVDGGVYSFSPFSYSIGKNNWQRDFFQKHIGITDSYENRYVFVALSHGFTWQDATVHFDNRTYAGEDNGSIALLLKEHKVTLLAPEHPFKRINGDNVEEEISTFTNLSLKLNDGKTYIPGQAGSIYRDEKMVLSYEYMEPYCIRLAGYRIYSDANRENLLKTLSANETLGGKAGTASCTIEFNSNLIQTIEKANNIDLGDFYIEPYFERIGTDIVVAENASNAEGVSVIPTETGSKKYSILDNQGTIGWLDLNQAKAVQDYLQIEYTPNENYHGEHGVGKIYVKYCDARHQLNTTTDTAWFRPAEGILDYNELIEDTCIGIEVYIIGRVNLTLKDKTVTYSGDKVEIDAAFVDYKLPANGAAPKHLNDIVYTYYEDEACTKELKDAPADAGTYYVVASMEGDENFVSSKSNVAKLVINKAVPKIIRANGTTITYWDPLSKSVFTEAGGNVIVHTVKGQIMSGGTMEWIDGTEILPAGYQKAKIRYTPSAAYAKNYTTYEDITTKTGKVTVKAASLVVEYPDGYFTYTGNEYPMQIAKTYLKDSDPKRKVTDAVVKYTYHTDPSCGNSSKISYIPKDAGTYYAKASVPSGGNYNAASGIATIVINKANASLLQVPLKNVNQEYRVYVQGVVGELPNGTIQLEVTTAGGGSYTVSGGTLQKNPETGRVFASFDYGEVTKNVEAGKTFSVKATYVPDADKVQNYNVADSVMTFENGVFALVEEVELYYGEATRYSKTCRWNHDFFSPMFTDEQFEEMTLVWLYKAGLSDAIKVTDLDNPASLGGGFQITAAQAGNAFILGHLKNENSANVEQFYLLYDVTVVPAKTNVILKAKEVEFDGTAKMIEPATVIGNSLEGIATNITDKTDIAYHYYSDPACENELDDYPVEAGTYYVQAETVASRNYSAGKSDVVTLTIKPVDPLISLEDLTVTYDGKAHPIEAVVEPTVMVLEDEKDDMKVFPVTGEVTYTYVNQDGEMVDEPVDAGIYEVTAALAADGNYNGAQATATVTIEKAKVIIIEPDPIEPDYDPFDPDGEDNDPVDPDDDPMNPDDDPSDPGDDPMNPDDDPSDPGDDPMNPDDDPSDPGDDPDDSNDNVAHIKVKGVIKVYDGQATSPKTTVTSNNPDLKAGLEAELKYEYLRRSGTLDEITSEAPVNTGLYYARAYTDGNGNFERVYSNIVLIWILKAQPEVVIPGVTKVEYTGQPVTVDTAVVTALGQDMTDQFEITYKYYEGLLIEKQEIEPPTEPGVYFVKAFTSEQDNFKAAESMYHMITIYEKQDSNVPNTSDNLTIGWYLAACGVSAVTMFKARKGRRHEK